MEEISDDVSALSMDGASAIAGNVFARRLRKDFADMQRGIPEHEEQQAAAAGSEDDQFQDMKQSSSALLEQSMKSNQGDELIEPFPKTFEEWQKKKHKKHKHKSKRHHKSSKSGSRSRSSKHSKERQIEQEAEENAKAPPIMEISIQPAHFEQKLSPGRHSDDLQASESRSYHSSMASTASSHSHGNLSSHMKVGSSLNGSGEAMGRVIKRSLNHTASTQTSVLSADSRENPSYITGHDSRENTTHMTGYSHMTGQSSANSQSRVTLEDLQTLLMHLERSRMDEKQVFEIHQRLEKEVQLATRKAKKAKNQRQAVELESQAASSERERLQKKLGNLQDENNQLRSKLRDLEDKETEEGLDDVLDSMEAKIKALKLKGRGSKQKTRKSPQHQHDSIQVARVEM